MIEFSQQIPRWLQRIQHLPNEAFPDSLEFVQLPHSTLSGDICNLEPQDVARMRQNSSAIVLVSDADGGIRFQVAKAESKPYIETIRLTPEDRPIMRMEANIMRPEAAAMTLGYSPLGPFFQRGIRAIHYDLFTRHKGKRHPAMLAYKFIPWALESMARHNPQYIFTEWEPGSINHSLFIRNYFKLKRNAEKAAQQTWSYKQFSALGFSQVAQMFVPQPLDGKKLTRKNFPPVLGLFGK